MRRAASYASNGIRSGGQHALNHWWTWARPARCVVCGGGFDCGNAFRTVSLPRQGIVHVRAVQNSSKEFRRRSTSSLVTGFVLSEASESCTA